MAIQDWQRRVLEMQLLNIVAGIHAIQGCVNNMVQDLYEFHWFGYESLMAINQYDDEYVRAVMLLLEVKLSPYNGFYYVLKDHLYRQRVNGAAALLVDEIDAPGYGGFCLRVPRHVVCGWRAGYDWGPGDVMDFGVVGYVNPRHYVNMQYAVNVQHYLKILTVSLLITIPVTVFAFNGLEGFRLFCMVLWFWMVVMLVVRYALMRYALKIINVKINREERRKKEEEEEEVEGEGVNGQYF